MAFAIARFTPVLIAVLLAGCGGEEGETATEVGAVSCGPQMSRFPVGEAHNIGYDARSCGTGTCRVSCPDQNANSDWGGAHHGIDVFARRGAPLIAVADGTITAVGRPSSTSGLRVRLRDACGWEYYYGHLDSAAVVRGQHVSAGDVVGFMGNSGTSGVHLHFNVSPDGGYYNDINPLQLLVDTSPTACAAQPPPPPPPPSTPPTPASRPCGGLLSNEYLAVGGSMPACNGAYVLNHQGDGNVVLYNTASGIPVFNTGTYGRSSSALIMQGDGNLVLYSGGTPLWASGTNGHYGASVVLFDDGNLVIFDAGGGPIWASNTRYAGQPGCGIFTGSLGRDQGVWSCNGRYLLAHQSDGNVVLYDQVGPRALWSTRTNGHDGAVLAVQDDGNLVIYWAGIAIWAR